MLDSTFNDLHQKFQCLPNDDWAFFGTRSTNRWTHGYHRYPAKFLPQLVQKIIETYAKPNWIIADVFAGCGTTLVESKVHGFKSIGVDINPVAQLITKAKINPLNPDELLQEFALLSTQIKQYNQSTRYFGGNYHERIDYWFREEEKNKISYLYNVVLECENESYRNFFLCALSNILKNCSRWLQSSTKPQIDPSKKIADPFKSFRRQVLLMIKKNEEYYKELVAKNCLFSECEILLADARKTTLENESVNMIITSPPYVTSYEYADIHQLTGYWYSYISDIIAFRKNFIGTFYSNKKNQTSLSPTARTIIASLEEKDIKLSLEVANYFNDMNDVAIEMQRILCPDGIACLVIGNTRMREVNIKSAEVFTEQLVNLNFEIVEVIKRKIPHKLMPTIRDKQTGKFTKLSNKNSQMVYPDEFVIVVRKSK
jgi:DNA modification methylase